MLLILTPNIEPESETYKQLLAHLDSLENIQLRVHREQGAERTLTEIYLIGNTAAVSLDEMRSLPGVERAVRVSEEYRVIGRHMGDEREASSTTRREVRPGYAARVRRIVRSRHTSKRRVDDANAQPTRTNLHAYGSLQPRTSPYSFQATARRVCTTYSNWRGSMGSK